MPSRTLTHHLRFLLLALLLTSVAILATPPRLVSAQMPDVIDDILDTEPNYSDDFGSDQEFWTTPYDGETSRFFKSGRFHIVVDIPDTVAYSRGEMIVNDFYAEVDTVHIAGDTSNQLGLIFHLQDENNFYFFAIGNDGYYALLKLENNSWTNLIDWTESAAIRSGSAARNRIAVLAEGSTMTLFVNDEPLGEIEDHTFSSGQVALTAGSYEDPGIEIAFDNFALWRLGEPVSDSPDSADTPLPLTPVAIDDAPGNLAGFVEEILSEDPDYSETFESGAGGWDVFETENVLTEQRDGSLVMLVRAEQRLGTSVFPRPASDFYMEVDTSHLDGPIDAEIGIVFRESDSENHYFYAISNDGYYSLWRKRNNEWQVLIDWTTSDALITGPGAQNTMGVLAQGERIAIFANETFLDEVSDSAFASGTIALVVGTFETGNVEIGFDAVNIWDLEATAPSLPPVERPEEAEPEAQDSEPEPEITYDAATRRTEVLATQSSFDDDFRRNTGQWDIVAEDDFYEFTYRQRALLGVLDNTEWVAWTSLLQDLTDYYFEVDTTQVSEIEDASYGLIFREQDVDNFYQFSISIYGNYSIWKSIDGEWINLVEWTNSPAIVTGVGETNRIGVLAEGSNIGLFVNGELIEILTDVELASGTVGLALETYEDPGLEVMFDNAELWDLDEQ